MERKKRKYTEQEAYLKLSALCVVAEYCLADMRKKMDNWLLDDEEAAKARVLKRLVDERFIDEERFAHAFVRDKFRYNRWGSVRIAQELRKKRIAQSIIDDALGEIDSEDGMEALRELIHKKRPSVKGRSEYEIRGKLIRFALSRGFEMDDVLRVVGSIDDCDD